MSPEKLLELENTFIRLYNQGTSCEEIAQQIELPFDVVNTWKSNLEHALSTNDLKGKMNLTVESKDIDGSYKINYSIRVEMSELDHLKFQLGQISSRELEPETSDLSIFNPLILKAKEHYTNVEQYLENIEIKESTEEEGKYNYKVYSKRNDNEILDRLEEAVNFYLRYVIIPLNKTNKNIIISEDTKDVYKDAKNILPYAIKQIAIRDFMDIKDVHIKDIPVDSKWIFITGENAHGKTTFLKSVALGLFGTKDEGINLINGIKPKIGIEYKNLNVNTINNIRTSEFEAIQSILCYGPSRLQVQSKMSQNEVSKQSSITYSLFNPDGILLNVENNLIIWSLNNKTLFDQVKRIFKIIIPSLSDITIKSNHQGDLEVLYVECDEKSKEVYEPVLFENLASGLRSTMAIVGDMLLRFIRQNPEIIDLSVLSGIVLIDELENHLHPKWQYRLPSLLSEAFPNVQFIVTTHSVIPILGAPSGSQFLKLNRSKETGVTLEKLEIDVANLLPNTILTSPIFDMSTILPVSNTNISEIRTEKSYDEVIKNDKTDESLKDFELINQDYPDSLFEE